MTLTPFTVYLIMQADTAWFVLLAIAIILAVSLLVALIMRGAALCDNWDEKDIAVIVSRKKLSVALSAALAVMALLPSTKTLCAAYVVPAIAQSDFIKKDAPELYDLAIGKLKEQIAPATLEKK